MVLFPVILILTCVKPYATDPCSTYEEFPADYTRSPSHKETEYDNTNCDSTLSEKWYRILGDAGTDLTRENGLLQDFGCGTYNQMWMNGTIPDVADGIVDREICLRTVFWSCSYSFTIQVKSCSSFRVYYLKSANSCPQSYCVGGVTATVTSTPASSTQEGNESETTNDPQKKNTLLIIVIIVVVTLFIIGVVIYVCKRQKAIRTSSRISMISITSPATSSHQECDTANFDIHSPGDQELNNSCEISVAPAPTLEDHAPRNHHYISKRGMSARSRKQVIIQISTPTENIFENETLGTNQHSWDRGMSAGIGGRNSTQQIGNTDMCME